MIFWFHDLFGLLYFAIYEIRVCESECLGLYNFIVLLLDILIVISLIMLINNMIILIMMKQLKLTIVILYLK